MGANAVRDYVMVNYIIPAKAHGQCPVEVRAGTVHSGLGLAQRLPMVSGAL